jgi:hypothetical protein
VGKVNIKLETRGEYYGDWVSIRDESGRLVLISIESPDENMETPAVAKIISALSEVMADHDGAAVAE